LTEPLEDELRAEDDDVRCATEELEPINVEPALDGDFVLEEPCVDTDCDAADDTGAFDVPGTLGDAHSVGNADKLDDALPGFSMPMFSLRNDRFCSLE
jgi:hypothetical protein